MSDAIQFIPVKYFSFLLESPLHCWMNGGTSFFNDGVEVYIVLVEIPFNRGCKYIFDVIKLFPGDQVNLMQLDVAGVINQTGQGPLIDRQ